MDDFDDSFDVTMNDNDSDAFSPEKLVKKAPAKKAAATAKPGATKKDTTSAPKKPAAPKSDKPKAPAKPRAKKQKVSEEVDEGMSFQIDHSFSILETPQASSEVASPPHPTVLQEQNAGGSKKNASETYQKVPASFYCLVTFSSSLSSNTFLSGLTLYVLLLNLSKL